MASSSTDDATAFRHTNVVFRSPLRMAIPDSAPLRQSALPASWYHGVAPFPDALPEQLSWIRSHNRQVFAV